MGDTLQQDIPISQEEVTKSCDQSEMCVGLISMKVLTNTVMGITMMMTKSMTETTLTMTQSLCTEYQTITIYTDTSP